MPKLFKEKKSSGAVFRQRRAEKEKAGKRMSEALKEYLTSHKRRKQDATASEPVSNVASEPVQIDIDESSTSSFKQPISVQEAVNVDDANTGKIPEHDEQPSTSSHSVYLEKTIDPEESNDEEEEREELQQEEQSTSLAILDLSDPANWPAVLTTSLRDALVRRGPAKQKTNLIFPKDAANRRFTKANYKRRLPNGEETVRNWLVYSVKLNKVFCFCCKLFATKVTTSLTRGGYNDWKNLSQNLSIHEKSNSHIVAIRDWNELSRRFGCGKTIDAASQRLLANETQHWQDVVKRLIGIVKYLGRQSLAFRGSRDTLYSDNNGNYLQLVEMLATFDTVMQEHLKRIKNKDIFQHYLGKDIQNELISLIAKEITKHILQLLKNAKYYSIILDCTPDITLIEQMTIIVRFVSIKEGESPTAEPEICIDEKFLGFIQIQSSTGEGLTEAILSELEKLKIPVGDMRGQGYDNGSNMKGKHQENLLSLSGSTVQWNVLKKHIGRLTLKPLSDTRWSSRIDAIRPFRFQVGEIFDALSEISRENSHTAMAQSDAESLSKELNNLHFLCLIVLWYNILNRINFVSKLLQSRSMYLPDVIDILESTTNYLKNYRSDKGFEDLLEEAKDLSLEMEIDPVFPPFVRQTKKKKMFCYEAPDDPICDPAKFFKIECFYSILDVCINSLDERFGQIKHHSKHFQFLYNIQKLKDIPREAVMEYCIDLQNILTDDKSGDADLDGAHLCEELTILAPILRPTMTLSQILAYALKNGFAPNVSIALRILLTLPISVASGERSFLNLKLIKNYLRSSMSQERLVGLAMISIENQIAKEIDFKTLLHDFVTAKVRRVKFL
ncbi:zinc finger MYM-type 1-like [Pelobates cultripes]|uniref:Zinc finger MYM-type 1-like n=1 Tax=Pelobates cultripes TaxID=61616 RepID=A0AAD1SCQ5_PELCU|nr:zinc finger MYM-type 1-like [Pelobates cultripes]